jgi:glutathione S-transferase
MAEFTFFTNPMSRGQIGRWALHEAGADYEQVLVDWEDKPAALIAANPLGKVPTIVHHAAGGDRVVSESAAICAYLAQGDLAPREDERADYYRWLFFAAGPLEQGITARRYGHEPKDARERIAVGFGDIDVALAMLETHLTANEWVCGDRFTMADVYVGSHVDWGLMFGTLPKNDAFAAYAARCQGREAYQAGKAIDNALIAQMQA